MKKEQKPGCEELSVYALCSSVADIVYSSEDVPISYSASFSFPYMSAMVEVWRRVSKRGGRVPCGGSRLEVAGGVWTGRRDGEPLPSCNEI